jgi:hypothetical protein
MATFSLNDLMFGDHGIANIPGILLADRAVIFARVVRELFEQGHNLGIVERSLSSEQIDQAIEKAKAEVCGVLGFRDSQP